MLDDLQLPTGILEDTLDEFLVGPAEGFQPGRIPGSPVVQLPSHPPLPTDPLGLQNEVARLRGIIQRQDQHIVQLTSQLQRAVNRLAQTAPAAQKGQPQLSLYQLLYGDNIPDDLMSIMEMDDL